MSLLLTFHRPELLKWSCLTAGVGGVQAPICSEKRRAGTGLGESMVFSLSQISKDKEE